MSGPNFFVPYVNDPDKAEKAWRGIKALLEDRHGWAAITDCRIFRLEYSDKGAQELAQVGEPHRYGHPDTWEHETRSEDTRPRESVLAIFENRGGPYLVCTHNRGVVHGRPILIGIDEPVTATYFAGYGPNAGTR